MCSSVKVSKTRSEACLTGQGISSSMLFIFFHPGGHPATCNTSSLFVCSAALEPLPHAVPHTRHLCVDVRASPSASELPWAAEYQDHSRSRRAARRLLKPPLKAAYTPCTRL